MSKQSNTERLHAHLCELLDDALGQFLEPDRMKATIVLRHESQPEICVVVSNDEGIEEVCALVRRHGGHVEGGGVSDLPAAPTEASDSEGGAS